MLAKLFALASISMATCNICVAESDRPTPAQACAAFDVHVLTRLEDHGRAATTTGHVLSTAMSALIDARAACFRGDYAVALDLYSRIDLRGPTTPLTGLAEAR